MKFKGTKGKWKMVHSKSKPSYNVIGTELGGRYKISRIEYILNSDVSEVCNNREMDEQKANALLISKSPEMLEMLSSVKDLIEAHPSESEMHLKATEIRSLIKQATEL